MPSCSGHRDDEHQAMADALAGTRAAMAAYAASGLGRRR